MLTHNAQLTVTDTVDSMAEAVLFDKTLHVSFDVVVPGVLADYIVKLGPKFVVEVMMSAALAPLYDIATTLQAKLSTALHNNNNNNGHNGPSVN